MKLENPYNLNHLKIQIIEAVSQYKKYRFGRNFKLN